MNKLFLIQITAVLMVAISSCDPKDIPENGEGKVDSGDTPVSKEVNIVSRFVYDGMSIHYYWADELKGKQPQNSDTDPANYFYKILNPLDSEKGWSWITDDADSRSTRSSTKALSFGYDLKFVTFPDNKTYAIVKYVHVNTPAARAGLQRLDLIGELDGKPIATVQKDGATYISDNDFNKLYGKSPVRFSVYRISDNRLIPRGEVTVTPDGSVKDPVIYKNIYTIGDKKIGYLFYTDYDDDFHNSLYEVFSRFKQNGVTDLVLDLRYNRGGAVSTAIYLASMIAPPTAVKGKAPFVKMEYNSFLNTLYDQEYKKGKYEYDRMEYLGAYDSSKDKNPLDANLGLDKVYIIATNASYSASELTLLCLRPHMDVVHIGSNTGGKYVASFSVHAYDKKVGTTVYGEDNNLSSAEKAELKNWVMQPIVAKYADKNSKDFSNPGYLTPDYELKEGFNDINYWTPIGDTKDVLLGQALYMISGDASYRPVQPPTIRSGRAIDNVIVNPFEEGGPVMMDMIQLTEEDFQKLRQLRDLKFGEGAE